MCMYAYACTYVLYAYCIQCASRDASTGVSWESLCRDSLHNASRESPGSHYVVVPYIRLPREPPGSNYVLIVIPYIMLPQESPGSHDEGIPNIMLP